MLVRPETKRIGNFDVPLSFGGSPSKSAIYRAARMSLYVCGYVHDGRPKTKVGITRNLRQRFDGLCAASPVHLEAYCAFDVPDFAARWMEREAHRMLYPWRSHGEWFDCDRKLAIEACEIAVSFEDAAEAFWRRRMD